jgi:uncharacterized membrane protein
VDYSRREEEKMNLVKLFKLDCRKSLLVILILQFVFASLIVFNVNVEDVSAAPVFPCIKVVPERIIDSTMTVGTNFTVSLYTDYNGSDIFGWSFNLTFDPYVLHLYYHNKMDTWTGNGVLKYFYATITPIVQDSEKVYVNGILQNKTLPGQPPEDYRIDYNSGRITFTFAPALGAEVKATYQYGIINGGLIKWTASTPIMFAPGEFDNTAGILSATDLTFDASITPPITTTGPGFLANITFTVVGTGISNITLEGYTALWGPAPPPDYQYAVKIIDSETMPDHIGHGYFDNLPNVYDVAVSKLETPTTAIPGDIVAINVTVRSESNFTQNFDVTVYSNTTLVDTKTANLARGAKATLRFDWNTTDAVVGHYTINATAWLAEDIDLSDNSRTGQTEVRPFHDVAITSFEVPEKALIGTLVQINVTVRNQGTFEENVTLTISYREIVDPPTPAVNITVTNFMLAERPTSKIILVIWNTTEVAAGPYKINATATIDVEEDPKDNFSQILEISLNPPFHDLAVTAVSPAKSKVSVGEQVTINVTVRNDGTFDETRDVKVTYVGSTFQEKEIDTKPISLLIGESKNFSFTWNTAGVAPGDYSVKAEAILPGDATPMNNGGSASVVVEALPPGHIAGVVKDASTENLIEGANVTTNGYFDVTDANGQFNITNVPAGKYNVTASKNGYEASTQIGISVFAGHTTNLLPFTLKPIPTTGHIAGVVKDASTEDPIEGADVTANGHFALTSADGSYSIELQPATYIVTVHAEGYENSSKTDIVVNVGETTTVNFELIQTSTVQPPDNSLYIALAVVAVIIIVAGIAIYLFKVKKK